MSGQGGLFGPSKAATQQQMDKTVDPNALSPQARMSLLAQQASKRGMLNPAQYGTRLPTYTQETAVTAAPPQPEVKPGAAPPLAKTPQTPYNFNKVKSLIQFDQTSPRGGNPVYYANDPVTGKPLPGVDGAPMKFQSPQAAALAVATTAKSYLEDGVKRDVRTNQYLQELLTPPAASLEADENAKYQAMFEEQQAKKAASAGTVEKKAPQRGTPEFQEGVVQYFNQKYGKNIQSPEAKAELLRNNESLLREYELSSGGASPMAAKQFAVKEEAAKSVAADLDFAGNALASGVKMDNKTAMKTMQAAHKFRTLTEGLDRVSDEEFKNLMLTTQRDIETASSEWLEAMGLSSVAEKRQAKEQLQGAAQLEMYKAKMIAASTAGKMDSNIAEVAVKAVDSYVELEKSIDAAAKSAGQSRAVYLRDNPDRDDALTQSKRFVSELTGHRYSGFSAIPGFLGFGAKIVPTGPNTAGIPQTDVSKAVNDIFEGL